MANTVMIEGKEYTLYIKRIEQPLRPYEDGESMDGISVWAIDAPEVGGMIACDQDDPTVKWYVRKDSFRQLYMEAPE